MTSKSARDKEGASNSEVTDYLCRRVHDLRKKRGWSLDALAQASGVSRSMLSQIERNQANPTLAVTMRIAQAFDLSLGELVENPHSASSIQIIRSDDAAYQYRSEPSYRIRTLSPLHLEKDVEFYELELLPGGALVSSPHFSGTREFLTVQKGRVEVRSGEEKAVLGRGDSCSYRADLSHSIINVGRGGSLIFLVDIYA